MPLEVEVKAPAPDLRAVAKALVERGAEFEGEREHIDTYFAHPGRDFAATDEALRLRRVGSRTVLTYKGPKLDTSTKTREELQTDVGDFDTATAMLSRLGFSPVGTVRKVRYRYKLDGLKVCLDDVEGLGTYVEVEGTGADAGPVREQVLKVISGLGLAGSERRSYLELLLSEGNLPMFAYGLLADRGALETRFGLANVTLTQGTIRGDMYDSGSYPVAVDGDGFVHGVLVRSDDLKGKLGDLDRFEGCDGGPDCTYRRSMRMVRLDDGWQALAWVYMGNAGSTLVKRLVAEKRLVPGGRWRGANTA